MPGFQDGTFRRRLHNNKIDILVDHLSIWASPQEDLSSGFPTKRVSNQSPQLQRLARKLKFHLYQVYI